MNWAASPLQNGAHPRSCGNARSALTFRVVERARKIDAATVATLYGPSNDAINVAVVVDTACSVSALDVPVAICAEKRDDCAFELVTLRPRGVSHYVTSVS